MDITSSQPERIILDRIKFASNTRLSREPLATARIHAYEDIISGQLVVALEAEVLVEKLVSQDITVSRVIEEPRNWWDQLKRDKWYTDLSHDRIMRAIAKRWPVRYKTREVTVTVRYDRYAKFPNSTLKVPELGKPVIFEQWGTPRWGV